MNTLGLVCAVAAATAFSAIGATNGLVINEIMYHPAHLETEAEDTSREWIELHNRSTNAINLHGWRLTRAVEFTFSNVTIGAGQYLVVAANRTNFLAQHPSVSNVVGNWAGRLSNNDDEIELINALGEEVDVVEYADSGEWAVRTRESADAYNLRGWGWFAPHDGDGMSLELINGQMPNDYGQNWAASLVANGTPGKVNSVMTGNNPPFIQQVSHFPLVPNASNTVTLKATIIDEERTGLVVNLHYRNASSAFPPAFTVLRMFDDGAHGDGLAGDGVFAATIPAQADLTVIEYYIRALDEDERERIWPAPARNAPDLGGGTLPQDIGANAVYQVDNTVYTGTQPYYRMIMTESERAFLASIAGGLQRSDASANGTFVSIDPNGTEVHQRASFRRRGAGSRGRAIPNFRANFASDQRWKGVTAINLNSQYPHSQVAGSALAAASGLQMAYQKPVQVRVNGLNLQGAGSLTPFAQQEVPDGDYARNHFPDDPNGNVYRASSGSHTATLAYLGENPVSYINAGYSKTANGAEYDWSDLINLTAVLNNTTDAEYAAAVRQRVDVEQWMRYFAVFSLLDSQETSLGTGRGDDYAMYRGLVDQRFLLLGHDLDTVLGQGDTAGNINDSIFRATAVAAVARFMRNPEFAPIYYQTLTNLALTTYSPERLGAVLDQHLGSWVSAAVIGNMKAFAAARTAAVMQQIPLSMTIGHSLSFSSGYPRSTASTVTLFGNANAISTRSVLVNGSPATWSAWNARWTNTVALSPGINRVLVQSLDAAGIEFERAYLDVWYDVAGGVTVSGSIVDDETWSPANGTYTITGPISITGGSTISILPGTTVFFAPGATLTVAAGRLYAVGSETNRIRFGRNPTVAGNWGGVIFADNTNDNQLVSVDFDSVGGTTVGGQTAQIHVNRSRVRFADCRWSATPTVPFISFDNSSFLVENSYFPAYPGPAGAEMLHGINGIPAGGYAIFRGNRFGRTWGYNDIIDFTGGNRPGPILQIIGNTFEGASDDHLDLDSTDAWIEGNVFLHAHRDPTRTDDPRDTASAISGGVDFAGLYPEWTIINNVFYDVDHVVLAKQGSRFTFVNNTVVHVNKENGAGLTNDISAFDWTDNGVALPDPAIGAGAYVAHNIIWDAPRITANYNPSNHTMILDNNILPQPWTGPGSNNVVTDPRLNLSSITNPLTASASAVLAAVRPLSGSPALGTGFGGKYNRGALNPLGLMVSGEPQGTTTVNQATLTVAPGGTFPWGTNTYLWGYTHYRWRLDNGPWSAEVAVAAQPSFSVSNLANGSHTVYVSGRNDAGYYQDDAFAYGLNPVFGAHVTASRTWHVNTNGGRIQISEILANNISAVQIGGGYPDLIELHNGTSKAVDLSGMSLTDDPTQPRKFIFRAGTVLAPGSNLVLLAQSGEGAGRIYLGFSLNDQGEGVYLFDSAGTGGALVDSVVFGMQLPDLSIGRLGNGDWHLTRPTFGAANEAQPVGDPRQLRINEWLAAAGDVLTEDFIEIYNLDTLPVALGGLALSESPIGSPRMSVIAPLSFIAGRGWQSFVADGDSLAGPNHVNFRLSADGGWISIADTNGAFIDIVVYATQYPDVTQGRSPDGTSSFVSFNQPTPGAGNPGQTIIITPITTTIVPFNQTWRMEASGIDLGTAWRATGYDDSAWFAGQALFFGDDSGNASTPLPWNSVIPFTSPKQVTVYFRTTFNYSGPTSGNFVLSHVIDDGAVVYLNNQEIYRYNFAQGATVTYNSRPSLVSGTAQIIGGIPVTLPLVQGVNELAIEVHQQSSSSSDIAMALALESQSFQTNYLGVPVVLNEAFTKNRSYTNINGKIVDWVELYNPSTNLIDISGMSLSDDSARPRRWVFPDGAAIAPGGYYVVEFDDSEAYTPFNAGFELSADSGAVYLFHRPTAGGALIDSVVYGVQVSDLSLGRAIPGPNATWTLNTPTRGTANVTVPLGSVSTLRVNEWMPNPDGSEDDWFEVYNPDPRPVALGGLHLTDNLSSPIKHRIRPLTFIGTGADAYLKFIADDDVAKGADHVSFALNNTTESIGIYTSNAVPTLINSVTYNNIANGVSQGRLPDGSSTIVAFTNSASPEEANWLPLDNVVISEVLSRPVWPMEQAIEIANPTDVDVAIGGWYLSNARRDLRRYRIPAGVIIPARSFKVFYESEFNTNNDVPPSFRLNLYSDDEVYLSAADGNGNLTGYRAAVSFEASAESVSFGRYEKSTGSDFVAMSARTFGMDNPATIEQFRSGTGLPNAYPRVGPLVINEINYHPPDIGTNDNQVDEFIEILNITGSPVPLFDPLYPTNAWRFRDGIVFSFPTNLTVAAGGYVLVVSFDPATNAAALAAFQARYSLPLGTVIVGPYEGKLDNSTDSLELLRPDAPVPAPEPNEGEIPFILVERVKYQDGAPWPSAADGNTNGLGLSLQRRVANEYGNDPINWVAGQPTPAAPNGAAGNIAPVISAGPSNQVVTAGNSVTLTVSATGAAPLTYQWRVNGVLIPNATNSTLTLPNVQPSRAGVYSVVVANPWGAAWALPARISVQAPPQVTQQPQNRTVLSGESATFVVAASGSMLQYQWRFNGTNLLNQTNSTLVINPALPANAGPYTVVVSNFLGSVTSTAATLTVLVPPSITLQPQDTSVIINTSGALLVTAVGTAPLSYQWRFNGTNIPGATASSYPIAQASPSMEGDYSVVVTNIAGSITSQVARVSVLIPPTITIVASDATAAEPANPGQFTVSRTLGSSSNLTVQYTVSGSASASDFVPLTGTLLIPAGSTTATIDVTVSNDSLLEGDETVIVTLTPASGYLVGSLNAATVTIHDEDNAPPVISITSPSDNQLFPVPTNIVITVSVSDPNGTVARVDYFLNGTNRVGESTAAPYSFTLTNAPFGTNVLVARVTDDLGATATSLPVTLIVNALPNVGIVSPVNNSTFSSPANFTINAFATDPDGSVTQVTFFANSILVGTSVLAPFATAASNLTPGAYALRAVALDNRGASVTSAVVQIIVNQPGIFDDFEPTIDLAQWSLFGGQLGTDLITTNYAGSVSGTRSLWFGGDLERFAATRGIDTTLGGSILFQLRLSNGSDVNWEQADLPSEGVVLEYSVNGGTSWTAIQTYDSFGAPYTSGWALQQFSLPGGAQSTNTMFRWRQLSHSGGCCDHWAIDDVQVLVGPTPPSISTHPADQFALAGSVVTFNVNVFGSQPLGYQWRFNGTNIAGANGSSYSVANVSSNNIGFYSVVVTNAYGSATSSNASLNVIQAGSDYFRIVSLRTDGSLVADHNNVTGDDRGGIAVSAGQVFVTGDSATARLSAANLSGATGLGFVYDGLVSDLRSQTVYTFGIDQNTPVGNNSSLARATHLLELNGNTGQPTGVSIRLTKPIDLTYGMGLFSGYGRVVVWINDIVYNIDVPSGAVTEIETVTPPQHMGSESWAFWGVAELTEQGLALVYVRDSQTISRIRIPSGTISTVGTFTGLSDMASFTVSVPRNRWYFHYEGSGQFGGSSETVGYANAQFALSPGSNAAPIIVFQPVSVYTTNGGVASLGVSVVGTPTLSYQWRFNNVDIPGAVTPLFGIANVGPSDVGTYSVVITNDFGSVTSAPAVVLIAAPPVITNQPQSLSLEAGDTAVFVVGHTGDGPFTYEWFFNGSPFITTTSNTLVLPNVNFYYNGEITVEVRNPVGSELSQPATLTVSAAPFFISPMANRQALAGMDVIFFANVDGDQPIDYRWSFNGTPIPSATNSFLSLTNVQSANAGTYRLVATNRFGSITGAVSLAIVPIDSDTFVVRSLTDSNVAVRSTFSEIGYYYQNGIAAGAQRVFVNGYGTSGAGMSASYNATDLSSPLSVGAARHGLVSDLKTRKLYSLAFSNNLIADIGGNVNSLIELDSITGAVTTNVVRLSTNLNIGYYSAIFSGWGRVVLLDPNNRVWDVSLPSGQVRSLGTQFNFQYAYAGGFAYRGWGVAERIGTNTYLLHIRDYQTIERVHVPSGDTEVVGSFSYLGDYPNLAVAPQRGRWFLQHAYSSQFTNSSSENNLVSATASFIYQRPTNVPPTFIDDLVNQNPLFGSTLNLSPIVDGSDPLHYRWFFNGSAMAGQTNSSLSLTNVRSGANGSYFVIVSNAFGAITSATSQVSVDYGASSSNTVALFTLNGPTWRYNQTASFNAPPTWTASNFVDSAWPTGRGLLAVESSATITPLMNTTLTLGRSTYYFRLAFNVTSNFPFGTMLRASTYIDDGAVIYINGREVERVRMPSGTINYSTFAFTQPPVNSDASLETWYWPATNLVIGTNVIAAEVHQVNSGSSDIVWGLALDAMVPVANRPPMITAHPVSQTSSNGSTVFMSVSATGSPTLRYQWRHEGTNIPGATSATLALSNLQRRHAGTYSAVVTNLYDIAVSSNATLVVNVPDIRFTPGGLTFTSPGQFTLQFSGDRGAVFAVDRSTNLVNWVEIGSVTNTSGAAQFIDPAGGPAFQFYRLRLK